MAAQVATVFTAQDKLTRTLGNIERSSTRLDRTLTQLRGKIRNAFDLHVINRGILLLERGLRRVIGAIPDLINRGEAWAGTVDKIVDITGMAAEQASELAAVAENVGVNSDGLGRMMNALARAVHTNAAELRDYGIRIKDANGHQLDAYTIFQNVRQRIAQMGPSLQAAKLGQLAFGRAALESADLLTLTNNEWERQIRLARESGLVLTREGLAAAEEWERTQSRLQQSITGIGAQILQGVAPALIGLTNGVTKTINANMDSIVRFASGMVSFLANLAADLLGVQIDVNAEIGNAYDHSARKAERLRRQIDDMTNSNQQSARASRDSSDATARARKEQERLADQIAKAQRQLEAARRQTTFTGGMNAVEIELMKQQRAAEIKAAEERVRDARKSLADHRRTMGQMTGVTATAAKRMRLDLQKTFGGGGTKGVIVDGLAETLKESRAFALQISDAIKDAIFGEDQQIQLGGGAPITIRTGGLLDKLGQVGTFLGTVGGHLDNLNKLLGGDGPLVLGILGLGKLITMIPGFGLASDLIKTTATRTSSLATRAGGPLGRAGAGAAMSPAVVAMLASWGLNAGLDRVLPPETPRSRQLSGDADSGWLEGWMDPARIMGRLTELVSGEMGGLGRFLSPAGGPREWYGAGYSHTGRRGGSKHQPPPPTTIGGMPWLHPSSRSMGPYLPYSNPPGSDNRNQRPSFMPWDSIPTDITPGFGIANPFTLSLDRVFRTWMGESSPVVRTGENQLGSLASIFGASQLTAEQTAPLGAGQMPVLVQNQSLPIVGNVGATIQNQALSVTGNVGALVTNTDIAIRGRVDSVIQNTVLKVNGDELTSLVTGQAKWLAAISGNLVYVRTNTDPLKHSNGLLVRMEGGSGGGTAALAGRVSTLETSVKRLATRNAEQDDRMDGIVNVNRTQSTAISARVRTSTFNGQIGGIKTVNRAQGNLLDAHETRLDRLDGGGSGPRATASAAETAVRRTASTSDQMLNVLRDIRAEIRRANRGGATTSSLRAGA